MTANQQYREYKKSGGTLDFKAWLTRENAKGTIGVDSTVNKEVTENLENMREMNKTILGFPTSTVYIAGAIILTAVVVVLATRKKD